NMDMPKILRGCLLLLLLAFFAPSYLLAAEPAWWTQQKQDCGLDPALAYNDWVAQGRTCGNGGNAGPSADQIARQQRDQQAQKDAEDARVAREKAMAVATQTRFEDDKNEALNDLKGSASNDDGL